MTEQGRMFSYANSNICRPIFLTFDDKGIFVVCLLPYDHVSWPNLTLICLFVLHFMQYEKQ
jgi:hypothetical protein